MLENDYNKKKENEYIKKYRFKINKNEFLINYMNVLKNYYNINSINFIIDNENNFYFYLNENKKILFFSFKKSIYELLKYLYVYNLNEKYKNVSIYYNIEINLININSIDINLNECNILYFNKAYNNNKKEIKKHLLKSLKE